MGDESLGDELTPSEERVRGLLADHEPEAPRGDPALTVRIVRHARWQRSTRKVVLAVAALVGAIADGVGFLRGGGSGGGR